MYTKPSFENLPDAVQEVNFRLQRIEQLLTQDSQQKNVKEDKRMNVKEAAEFINCAISTVYGLVCNRKIPHEKKGKKLYFLKSDLVQWLKKGKRLTIDEMRSKV